MNGKHVLLLGGGGDIGRCYLAGKKYEKGKEKKGEVKRRRKKEEILREHSN